jgi:hypothetical protein
MRSRDPNSEYQADGADPPRSNMNAGCKSPEREQCEDRKGTGVTVHHACNIRYEHQMHRHKDRRPMQRLRPDQAQPLVSIADIWPSRCNANNSHQWCKKDPIKRHWRTGDRSVSHTNHGKHQHQEIRPLSFQQSP